jgi:hypothetical protein
MHVCGVRSEDPLPWEHLYLDNNHTSPVAGQMLSFPFGQPLPWELVYRAVACLPTTGVTVLLLQLNLLTQERVCVCVARQQAELLLVAGPVRTRPNFCSSQSHVTTDDQSFAADCIGITAPYNSSIVLCVFVYTEMYFNKPLPRERVYRAIAVGTKVCLWVRLLVYLWVYTRLTL